ncbi:MAG TPA: acetate/propionate family kinase [Vicinamibacterales bacterium]|nr:acetate/propionate family kinase [Vicinamibacterales bacterium]
MSRAATERAVVAVNGGSSSVKCGLFTMEAIPRIIARTMIPRTGPSAQSELIAWIESWIDRTAIDAIGHRIVHGGPVYSDPQIVTERVRAVLSQLVPFAPNHLPAEIELVDALGRYAPDIPQVLCFDTAFHNRMPKVARRLPLPVAYDERGIRRYGFHGLSYAFLMDELTRVAGTRAANGRIVLAHLGNGSSLAAVRGGVGIDTTMGLTPIGGVVMSTRSGDLDPGVVTYLGRTDGLTADRLEEVLSGQSGLLALSQTTGDMQQLLAREPQDPAAQLAIDSYVYSVVKACGALAAALHGMETLVFSGGIGEHAAVIRARICGALSFLGVDLDDAANRRHADVISSPVSRVVVRVIPTDEELMVAKAAHRLLARDEDGDQR